MDKELNNKSQQLKLENKTTQCNITGKKTVQIILSEVNHIMIRFLQQISNINLGTMSVDSATVANAAQRELIRAHTYRKMSIL